MNIKLKNKYLYFDNYKLRCSIGKRGITSNKTEGDQKTPKGIYNLKSIYYRKDRVRNFKTLLKKWLKVFYVLHLNMEKKLQN